MPKILIILIFFISPSIKAQVINNSVLSLVNLTLSEMNSIVSPNKGSIFFNSDDNRIYKYNGTSWLKMDVQGNAGSVFFADVDGTAFENNNNLFWNNTTNRLGIGTNSPSATLEIENTLGVPLKIEPSPTTPTGTETGQIFVGTDGIAYLYDASRSKWLSFQRMFIGWGRNSANSSFEYLRQYNGSPSNRSGWRIMRDATITAITAQTQFSETWTLRIRKNNSTTNITDLTITASSGSHLNNLNIDIDEGDFLQAYCDGSQISYPQTLLEIAWRK